MIIKTSSVLLIWMTLASCSSNSNDSNSTALAEEEKMQLTDIQESPTTSPKLLSWYGYQPSKTEILLLAFYSDNRYLLGGAMSKSANTLAAEAVAGSYQEADGTFTLTPLKGTCIGRTTGAKILSIKRATNGDKIVYSTDKATVVLDRVTEPAKDSRGGAAIFWGCICPNNAFVQGKWQDKGTTPAETACSSGGGMR